MRSHFINYTTVGVFVAAMIVELLWALTQISGRTGPTDTYAIVMDAVTDIDYGTLVRYEGYKIGQVERIEPEWADGKYRFRVVVSVEKDWKVPSDSVARISASSFLAGKTVEVFGGKSAQLVAVGGEIQSGPPADAFSLMAQVAGQIGDLSETSLKPLIANVNDIITRIGNKTDTNLEELFTSLQAIATEVQNKTPKITGDISAKEKVRLLSPAILNGSVKTPTLSMEEGVLFNGNIEMAHAEVHELPREAVMRSVSAPVTNIKRVTG